MRRHWTQKEIDYLVEHYPDIASTQIAKDLNHPISSIYGKAYELGLKKSEKYLSSPAACRLRRGDNIGAKTRFPKGHIPMNKGKKQIEYMSQVAIDKSKQHRYPKGNLPHNTKEDGAISIRTDNRGVQYKFIRVALGKWIHLHVHVWIQNKGKIPAGKIVAFKNRNTMDCDIENLELITRQENMQRNSIHRYPEELKETIRLIHKINRKINAKEQN